MKKLTSILLSLTILAGATAIFAEEEGIMPISETEAITTEAPVTDVAKTAVSGVVKSVTDEQIELEDLVLNIDNFTFVGDYNFNSIEQKVKEGDEIYAIVSQAQTRSLPAQSYAFYILVKTQDDQLAPFYTTVASVEDGFINSLDGQYTISYEEAQVSMFKIKRMIEATELTEGSEIVFYSEIMTMSIPALVNPSRILVLSLEGNEEAEYLQQNGILLGTNQGLELTRNVTRAEAVTFLSRVNVARTATYDTEVEFDDVAKEHWAFDTIQWAKNTGIIEGTSATTFSPDNTVTGRQFVKMLLSMNGEEGVTIENAFDKGVEANIVTNSVLTKVEKDENLTRNDVSILLYNAIQK